MRIYLVCLLLAAFNTNVFSQNSFNVFIADEESGDPLIGVTVFIPELNKGGSTNTDGFVSIQNIPNGAHIIEISYIGYEKVILNLSFPLPDSENGKTYHMHHAHEEMEEVVISSTRSSRTIKDIPTRVEFIAGEELSEKGNMKPGDIRMLLNESTGIQTQQTSATSYNSSIRIQGLDGKYTQLIRDGLPLYSGYSGGLSLMQIAPLDLKQVEVIKGASSTLYGGGAISGLVNLISETPGQEPELSFMVNGTSAAGLDLSGFYSGKTEKVGATVFASYNKGAPYDPADIGLTAIPKFDRFTLNPKLFLYPGESTEAVIGLNYITEERLGGNIDYVKGEDNPNAYFEQNNTYRASTQLGVTHHLSDNSQMELKNSISFFSREIMVPDFTFSGSQLSSFSELNYSVSNTQSEWIGGLNLWTESFDQKEGSSGQDLDFSETIVGTFVQNTWNTAEKWTLESGLRTDYHTEYGFFVLPRMSVMYTASDVLTMRLGGGLGYKTPTVFTEDAERLQFQNIRTINTDVVNAERSYGANFDINYRWPISEELSLSTNTLFFYTRINHPLVLTPIGMEWEYLQPDGFVDTKGVEINMKWSYQDLKLFAGYTFAEVQQHYNGNTSEFPLVAKHRLNNVLMYEKHGNFWIGLEAYYFSPQKLGDGSTGKSYWIVGLMTEKKLLRSLSLFLNFENFLDTRQTDFDTIYTGSINNPQFRDIYAPVDGFVINGGVKLSF